MKKNLEVILDTNPSGGCGCNCGCGGSSVIDDMNELVDNLKEYNFKKELSIDVLPVSEMESVELMNKINTLLSSTNAVFRVNSDNLDETLSNLLPIITMDGKILTAFGVPRLHDVVVEVEKAI